MVYLKTLLAKNLITVNGVHFNLLEFSLTLCTFKVIVGKRELFCFAVNNHKQVTFMFSDDKETVAFVRTS